jgi:hypothetical protein
MAYFFDIFLIKSVSFAMIRVYINMNKISITLSLPTTKYPSENIDAYSQKEEEELYKKAD